MQIPKKSVFSNNLRLIISLSIIVLGILFYWLYKSYLINPNAIFNGMILNNLNTRSYVVADYQQQLTGSLVQRTLVNSGANNIVTSQETTNLTSSKATIVTLSIGTPSTDYSTYQKIDIGQSSAIYNQVIGIWGVNSINGINGQGGQLYKSTMLAPFLFASPSVRQTNLLTQFIKQNQVYVIKTSKLGMLNGRQVMNYEIKLNLSQYAKLLNLYLSIIGYRNQSQGIQYSGNQTANLEISVDVLSRQLMALSYLGNSSIQVYSAYGINSPIKLPLKAIPLQNLKNLVSSLSK
jgi:hypothetical protein